MSLSDFVEWLLRGAIDTYASTDCIDGEWALRGDPMTPQEKADDAYWSSMAADTERNARKRRKPLDKQVW